MCRDQVSNPGPLALKSDALPAALHAQQLLVYDDLAYSSINVSCDMVC